MYARFFRLLLTCLFLITGFARPVLAQEKREPANQHEEQGDDVRAREDWFYQQRAFPLVRIPPGARWRALGQLEEMRRREGLIALEAARVAPAPGQRITASTTQWTPVGPQPTVYSSLPTYLTSGRVAALAADPRDSNVAYLGGAQGGIWKTMDGGLTWTPITDDQASLAIGSIALDPANPDIVYVGTGEQHFSGDSYYGAGILKSSNGGLTWTQLPGPFVGPFSSGTGGARIGALEIHPTNTQTLLAGVYIASSQASSGIYRSTDGGLNWTLVLPGAAGTSVQFDRTNPTIAYASLGSAGSDSDNGIYKSTDAGVSWTKLAGTGASLLPTVDVGRIELAIAPSNPATLYAGFSNSSTRGLLGFYKTVDGGQNWTQLTATPDYCTPQCWYDHVVRVHPTDSSIVYAGGSATSDFLIRSLNGGTSWSRIYNGANGVNLHVDQHSLAFSTGGTKLYVGNDGGAWSTTDTTAGAPSVNWTNLNSTLSLTQFYPGHSFHPSDEQIGLGGTQDNGTQKFSGVLPWTYVTCGDGGWTAIDTFIPSTAYSTCQNIAIRKSTQNGNPGTWTSVITGINTADRVAFIPPFVLDPSQPNRLYFGTYRVYQTADSALNWMPISGDLTNSTGSVITTIGVAPGNSDVVYIGSSNSKVQVTTNAGLGAGATWLDVSSGLPPRFVTQVSVDPLNPATAIVTFSGFSGFLSGDTQGHIFRTTNSGVTWTDISGNLPNIPVNDVVIDPDVPNTFYVATDVGVFSTADGGATWTTLVTGLPRVAVLSLKLRPASRTLRAATHGRGVWDLALSNFTPAFRLSSIAPSSAAAGAAGFTLTANGVGFSSTSVIRWNGVNLATTFNSATQQLTANLAGSDLATAAAVPVAVFDPAQSPGTSNALAFAILNPSPTLASIVPNSALAGGAGFTLTVNGTNFISGTTVRWNGSNRATSLVSSTQVTANIPASDLAQAAFVSVTVFVPQPGGGASSAQTFTVSTTTPPLNDNFASATVVTAAPFTDSVNTFAATTETSDPTPTCATSSPNSRAKSIWYRYTPAANGAVTADTIGSVYDTILSVYTGNLPPLTAFACDDDSGGGTASRVNLTVTAGTTYYFMVTAYTNFPNESGQAVFNLTSSAGAANDFTIGANPNSAAVTAGQSATATVTLTPLPAPFATAITLSCSALPALSACSFSPPSVTPGASPATSTLTISTTASGAANPATLGGRPGGPAPPRILFASISLLGLFALFALGAGKKTRKLRMGFYAGCVLMLAIFAAACGGGGGGAPPPPNPGTPPGVYTVTVTGTSGNVVRSATFTLTVR